MLGTGGRGGKHASILGRSLERKRLSVLPLEEMQSGCALAIGSFVAGRSELSRGSINKFVESSGSCPSEDKRKALLVESSGSSWLEARRNAL